MKRLLPVLVAVALTAVGCASGADRTALPKRDSAARGSTSTTAGSAAMSTLVWGRCENQTAAAAGLRCASLDVPLDPRRSGGPTLSLALARKVATGPSSRRIGSLVLNPGGPGGSGIEFLASAATQFPAELTERFDLVSFDPRGVGESSPVRCVDDAEKDRQLSGDLSPDTPAEVATAQRDQTVFRDGCERGQPELVRHMGTVDVAEDLDRIRAALGDERLTFVGFSYGTSIAATYATVHPDRVRALVLDGSVSPGTTQEDETLTQARGFERTLRSFVTGCDASPSCALAPDSAAAIAAARASLEQDPVQVRSGAQVRTLGPDQFDIGLATALYDTSTWGVAASAVKNLRTTGARTLLTIGDQQSGRQSDGSYDNSADAQSMVACADSPERPTAAEAEAAARRIAAVVPGFGNSLAWSMLGCVGWPVPARPLPRPSAPDAPPLLVVGTVGDPATPYEWAKEMTTALGTATLLTYEGDGHTAFLRGGPCIDDKVVRYLVDLKVPAAGTRCPKVATTDAFGGLRDELVDQFTKGGVPRKVAECVVDRVVDQIGEERLTELLLDTDNVDELSKYVTAATLQCATGG